MVTLFTSYFDCDRSGELQFALYKNIKCAEIDSIVVVSESGELPEVIANHRKVHVIEAPRPTYGDFFRIMRDFDGVRVLSNSDIYFNESAALFNRIGAKECYALTRHEYTKSGIRPFPKEAHWSQDVWVFAEDSEPQDYERYLEVVATTQGSSLSYKSIPFYLGIAGCDNHIAHLLSNRYRLINPYPQIKAIHVHADDERNYQIKMRITGNHSRWGQLQKVMPSKL